MPKPLPTVAAEPTLPATIPPITPAAAPPVREGEPDIADDAKDGIIQARKAKRAAPPITTYALAMNCMPAVAEVNSLAQPSKRVVLAPISRYMNMSFTPTEIE